MAFFRIILLIAVSIFCQSAVSSLMPLNRINQITASSSLEPLFSESYQSSPTIAQLNSPFVSTPKPESVVISTHTTELASSTERSEKENLAFSTTDTVTESLIPSPSHSFSSRSFISKGSAATSSMNDATLERSGLSTNFNSKRTTTDKGKNEEPTYSVTSSIR